MADYGPFTYITPNLANFSWINQNSAVAAQVGDTIYLSKNDTTGGLTILKAALPAAPCTVEVFFNQLIGNANYQAIGICLRESASGKLVALHTSINSAGDHSIWADYYPDYTGVGVSNYTWFSLTPMNPIGLRFRITDGSPGTRYFGVSADGINWWEFLDHANDTDITPDEIGFYIQSSAVWRIGMSVLSITGLPSYGSLLLNPDLCGGFRSLSGGFTK